MKIDSVYILEVIGRAHIEAARGRLGAFWFLVGMVAGSLKHRPLCQALASCGEGLDMPDALELLDEIRGLIIRHPEIVVDVDEAAGSCSGLLTFGGSTEC